MDRFFFSLIGTYDFLFNFIVVSSHLTTGTVGEISEEISSTNLLEPEPHLHSVIRHRTSRPTGYRKWQTLNPLDPPEFANLPIPSTIQPYILLTSSLLALVVRSLTFTVRLSLTRRDTRHLRSRPLPNPCTRVEELACFSRNLE